MSDGTTLRYIFEIDNSGGKASIKEFNDSVDSVGDHLKKTGEDGEESAGFFEKAWEHAVGVFEGLAIFESVEKIGEAVKEMIGEALEFEQELSQMQGVMGDSGESIGELGEKLVALGGEFGTTTDRGKALFVALKSGVEAADSIDFVKTAMEFAKAAMLDAADASKVLSTTLNAYGLSASEASHVSDVYTTAINMSASTSGEFTSAMQSVLAISASAKVPIEEMAAAIATITKTGIPAQTAAQGLGRVIQTFVNPSNQAREAAAQLGIQLGETALESKGLQGAMEEVAEKTGGDIAAITELFGNMRTAKDVLALTGAQAETFAESIDKLTNSVGNNHKIFEEQQNNLRTQWQTAMENLQLVVERIGPKFQFLTEALKSLNQQFSSGFDPLNAFNLVLEAMGVTLAGLAVASVGQALATAFGATSILIYVRNIGDLRLAVEMLAGASGLGALTQAPLAAAASLGVLSTVGLAGLTAAIGYSIGSLVNWLIEGTKVRTWIDDAVQTTLSPFIDRWYGVSAAQKETLAATQQLEDTLRAHGITVDKTGLSAEQYRLKLIDAGTETYRMQGATDTATGSVNNHRAGIQLLTEAQKEFNKNVQEIIGSVTGENKKSLELVAALQQLSAAHVDDGAIITKLGPEIIKYTDLMLTQGTALDANMQHYRALALKREEDNAAAERSFQTNVDTQKILDKNAESLGKVALKLNELPLSLQHVDEAWLKHGVTLQELQDRELQGVQNVAQADMEALAKRLQGDTTYSQKIADITAGITQMKQGADDAQLAYETTLKQYETALWAGASDVQLKAIQDQANGQFKTWQEYFKELVKLRDEDVKIHTQYQHQLYTTTEEAAEKMQFAMADAMKGISTGLANDIANDLVHWQNFGDSLKKLGEDTAQKMLSAFLQGLFTPLTNELTKLGKQFADWASGALFNIKDVTSALSGGASGASGAIGGSSGAGGLLSGGGGILGGLISGGISAIASLVGDARLEGTLNAIEYNTRATYINVAIAIDQALMPMLETLDDLGRQVQSAGGPVAADPAYLALLAGIRGGTTTVPQLAGGGTIQASGIAVVHKDETVITNDQNTALGQKLDRIAALLEAGHTIEMDGQKVSRVVSRHQYSLTRNERFRTVGGR